MSPMGPAEAAEAAGAGTATGGEAAGGAAGGMAGGMGGGGTIIDRLFDGSAPGPAVPQLMQQLGLERPHAMIARGVMRVSTGDGVPPIAEILIGMVLTVMNAQQEDGVAGEPAERDTQDSEASRSTSEEGNIGEIDEELRKGEI